MNELKKNESNVGRHLDGYTRMNDRENAALRLQASLPASKMTRKLLDQKRRASMVAENNEKFGKVSIGIHGGELP